MVDTPLSCVLERHAHADRPVFGHSELAPMDSAELLRLLKSGILTRASDASAVPCPSPCIEGCDMCVMKGRQLATCKLGRVRPVDVNAADLARYKLKTSTLARRIAKANDLKGRVRRGVKGAFRLGWLELGRAEKTSVWLMVTRKAALSDRLYHLLPTAPARPLVILVPEVDLESVPSEDVLFVELTRSLDPQTLQVDWGTVEARLEAMATRKEKAQVLLRITALPRGQHPPRTIAMLVGDGAFQSLRKPIGVRELFFLNLFAESGQTELAGGQWCTVVPKEHAVSTFSDWAKAGRMRFRGKDRARPAARVAKMWREFVRQMNMTPGLTRLFVSLTLGFRGDKAYAIAVSPGQIESGIHWPSMERLHGTPKGRGRPRGRTPERTMP